MRLLLYKYTGEKRVINKSLTQFKALEGTLREPSSVLNPVIVAELEGPSDILQFNYAFIAVLDRYYYVTDIVALNNTLYELHLKVDVLRTYKDEITPMKAYVSRNQHTYNNLLVDNKRPFTSDKVIQEIDAPRSEITPVITHVFNSALTNDNYNIVMNCIPNLDASKMQAVYNSQDNVGALVVNGVELFGSISGTPTGNQINSIYYVFKKSELLPILIDLINNHQSDLSFIKSLIAYPTGLQNTTLGEGLPLKIGSQMYLSTGARYLPLATSPRMVIEDFEYKITSPTFKDYKLNKYEIYIPYLGYREVQAEQIINKRVVVGYVPNFEDGSAIAYVYNVTDNTCILEESCQLGVSIGLSATNGQDLADNRLKTTSNMILTTLSSTASVLGGVATGNPLAITGGVIGAVGSITNGVTSLATDHLRASMQFDSGMSGLYAKQRVRIKITKVKEAMTSGDESSYLGLYGAPLERPYRLSDLTGYTEILNVHLSGFTHALEPEKDEIESLLKSGVIL